MIIFDDASIDFLTLKGTLFTATDFAMNNEKLLLWIRCSKFGKEIEFFLLIGFEFSTSIFPMKNTSLLLEDPLHIGETLFRFKRLPFLKYNLAKCP